MTMLRQIIFLVIAVQWWEANGHPFFQGISFQKGFEINFKPLPRKPISLIKEKWSPFGVFGKKHIIQKRNTEFLMPVSPPPLLEHRPAPVFEHIDEIQQVETSPLRFLQPQPPRAVSPTPVPQSPSVIISSISPPRISPIPPPVISTVPPLIISSTPRIISSPAPPPVPLNIIITPTPPPIPFNVNITPVPKPILSNMAVPILPPPNTAEKEVPLISSNLVVPPPNKAPPPGLFTDISRSEPVREYMDTVQPIPPPIAPPIVDNTIKPEAPRPDIVINDNALVRGSKLALYFGSIFLQLMSQFMTNARATFDQMTNPPPVYNK